MGSLVIRSSAGAVLVDGAMNNLIADGAVGDAATYWFAEVANTHAGLGVTALRLYVGVLDTGGGTYSVAVGDGTARALTHAYAFPAGSGLTYTTATTAAAGLALPDLAAGTKCLICVKRDLTSGSAAWPETNAIGVGYTAPIGYV